MKHFEIGMGLIKQGEAYLLQLRNGKQQAGALNLIGCFGGQIEPGESPEQTVCREVAEESSFRPKPEGLKDLGEVNVNSERHGQVITVHSYVYLIEIPSDTKIVANEGEVVMMTRAEVLANPDKMTPATLACFEQLIKE